MCACIMHESGCADYGGSSALWCKSSLRPAALTGGCRVPAELLMAVEQNNAVSWPFLKPVETSQALDYYDIIIDPIDLSLMRSRLGCGQYYVSLEMFVADMRKMCDNCRCVCAHALRRAAIPCSAWLKSRAQAAPKHPAQRSTAVTRVVCLAAAQVLQPAVI